MAAILYIDDEPNTLQMRKLTLEANGHQVIEARSGEEGLKLLRSTRVDIVILDYWMSGMNGLAVGIEIKKSYPNIPIIISSGLPELPGESIGIADRWILKGSRAQELLDAVTVLTDGRKHVKSPTQAKTQE